MKDYSMYRFYKGESENPFNNQKQNTAYQFWGYEASFEHRFKTNSNSDDKDKKQSFEKWLKDLFVHLADKYESMDSGEHFEILYKQG